MTNRKIERIQDTRQGPGFLGPGHIAIPVLDGNSFAQTDPFILLMDDQLDLPGGEPVGGAHPHAGFETVTLVLEGDANNKSKTLQTGGMEWMTAGSGIVHTEEIDSSVRMRILQLWLVLPKDRRWAEPKWQELHLDNVPIKRDGGNEIRVYSGTSQGMTAPTINETPATIADFNLQAGYEAAQALPAGYNGFIYVIEGSVEVADATIGKYQVGWLSRPADDGVSEVAFKAGKDGVRFVLYAGEPQGAPIVSHGPFIGDTEADIYRLYREYREGKMGHVHDLPAERVIRHQRGA